MIFSSLKTVSLLVLCTSVYIQCGFSDSHDHDSDDHDSHDHDSHDHDDHGHEDCACIAEEYDFEISCTTNAALTAYLEYNSSSCASSEDCSSSDNTNCQKLFYIVQAIHDYCPDDGQSDIVLTGFHDMEENGCEECHINKQYDASLDSCPEVDCTDSEDAAQQIAALTTHDCSVNCNSTECMIAFQAIRSYHDSCEDGDDALTDDIETGIHDYEDICADFECNTVDSAFDLECDDHDSNAIMYGISLFALLLPFFSIF